VTDTFGAIRVAFTMTIPWPQVLDVLQREPQIVQQLFIRAYTRAYLRDRHGQSISDLPRRVVVLGSSLVVLKALDSDQLHVQSIAAVPPAFVYANDGEAPLTPSDLLDLLVVGQFDVMHTDSVRFRIRHDTYTCSFSRDYSTWRLSAATAVKTT